MPAGRGRRDRSAAGRAGGSCGTRSASRSCHPACTSTLPSTATWASRTRSSQTLAFQVIGPMEAMICKLLSSRDIQQRNGWTCRPVRVRGISSRADDAAEDLDETAGWVTCTADQPEMLHRQPRSVGHGSTYVRSFGPRRALRPGCRAGAPMFSTTEPHEGPRHPVGVRRPGTRRETSPPTPSHEFGRLTAQTCPRSARTRRRISLCVG